MVFARRLTPGPNPLDTALGILLVILFVLLLVR